jgi:hypothetical protein
VCRKRGAFGILILLCCAGLLAARGYHGPLCSVCVSGYNKNSDLSCTACSSDPTRALTAGQKAAFYLYAVFGTLIVLSGLAVATYGVEEAAAVVCSVCIAWRAAKVLKRELAEQQLPVAQQRARRTEKLKFLERTITMTRVLGALREFGAEKAKVRATFTCTCSSSCCGAFVSTRCRRHCAAHHVQWSSRSHKYSRRSAQPCACGFPSARRI